eukprot:TRINITY_DN818_c0_g3_i1.p1 TRINITY_DN818_c0_g3~~TRINITY_DN818_c0_g3_i1.p1  ORF type:complete len:616 (+),score=93.35 TRINITY_DN818_c0_g3_i1:108-1955(+)
MERAKVILLFADEWGTSVGGISAFNLTLATALKAALPDWAVACAVLEKNIDQQTVAREPGIELICRDSPDPTRFYGCTDELFEPLGLPPSFLGSDVKVIFAHAPITGRYALAQRNRFPNAKYVLFNHGTSEEFDQFCDALPSATSALPRVDELLNIFQLYDVVVSVGPRIYANWETRYSELLIRKFQHVQMLPLIASHLMDIEIDSSPHRWKTDQVVLCFGRAKDIFAAKSMSLTATVLFDLLGPHHDLFGPLKRSTLQVRIAGAETAAYGTLRAQVMDKFSEQLRAQLGSLTEVEFLSHDQVLQAMKTAAVCLMPSLEEPFGLAAMEAMAIGKITLISNNSGLADFLYGFDRVAYEVFVVPTIQSTAPADVERNAQVWGRKLRAIFATKLSFALCENKAVNLCLKLRGAQDLAQGVLYSSFANMWGSVSAEPLIAPNRLSAAHRDGTAADGENATTTLHEHGAPSDDVLDASGDCRRIQPCLNVADPLSRSPHTQRFLSPVTEQHIATERVEVAAAAAALKKQLPFTDDPEYYSCVLAWVRVRHVIQIRFKTSESMKYWKKRVAELTCPFPVHVKVVRGGPQIDLTANMDEVVFPDNDRCHTLDHGVTSDQRLN